MKHGSYQAGFWTSEAPFRPRRLRHESTKYRVRRNFHSWPERPGGEPRLMGGVEGSRSCSERPIIVQGIRTRWGIDSIFVRGWWLLAGRGQLVFGDRLRVGSQIRRELLEEGFSRWLHLQIRPAGGGLGDRR